MGKKMWMELTSETSNWQISWKSCKWEWENWTLLAQIQGQWINGSEACRIKPQVTWEAEKLYWYCITISVWKTLIYRMMPWRKKTSRWHSFAPCSIFQTNNMLNRLFILTQGCGFGEKKKHILGTLIHHWADIHLRQTHFYLRIFRVLNPRHKLNKMHIDPQSL